MLVGEHMNSSFELCCILTTEIKLFSFPLKEILTAYVKELPKEHLCQKGTVGGVKVARNMREL